MTAPSHDGAASALFRPEVVLAAHGADTEDDAGRLFGLGGARVASLLVLLATLALAAAAAGFGKVWSRPPAARAEIACPAEMRAPAVAGAPDAADTGVLQDTHLGSSSRPLIEPRRP